MSLLNLAMFTATLADNREETTPPSSSSPSSLLLITTTTTTTTPFSSSSFSCPTTLPLIIQMPSKTPQLSFQKLPKPPSTSNPITSNESTSNDYPLTSSPSSIPHRRLPLPTKLSFEQNLTNLIEKESPLLQSELLTAEHELSVFRSRLAVNEGVTAVSGSILQSLKEQFQSNQTHQSSAIQTSPTFDSLPDSLEIHYDDQSPRSPCLLIKAKNSFWLAQPLNKTEVRSRLENFSSPMMKRARIQFPDDFEFDDIDQDSISDDDQLAPIAREEQLLEMKTIRSSSLVQPADQFERFDLKLDEIYSSIDALKHSPTTHRTLNQLQDKLRQLKLIMHEMHFTKEDELRLEYEFDELENLFHHTNEHEDYNLLELFEQNLNELQHIIEEIQANESPRDLIAEFQTKLDSIEKKSYPRLIPENPIVTKEVFFEGEKIARRKKPAAVRLIPEDPQINASSFYEGDIHRSFYPHPPEPEKKVLIPEKPLVSSEVFYEGDPQRSMFIQRTPPAEILPRQSTISIENLREIMSDLMLAASWSKKPSRLERQSTKDNVEIHAESFLTMEEQHSDTPLCEIIHEIEDFSIVRPPILIEEETLPPPTSIDRSENFDEQDQLYYQVAVQIVNDVIENILLTHDDDFNSIVSSRTSASEDDDDEDEVDKQSKKYSSADTDEENEQLIPQISDQPYLFVTDVVTSKSTQELGNLVQELQVLEHHFHGIHSRASSSSSSDDDDDEELSTTNLSIPTIVTTRSVTELNNLVSELQNIEDKLADKLESSPADDDDDEENNNNTSPISSKSFNELGGLINELKTVTNRIHEEIFTSKNIDSLSQDIVKHRRESLLDEQQSDAVDNLIQQVLQEAQQILLSEVNLNRH